VTPAGAAKRFVGYSALGWALESLWRRRLATSVVFGDAPVPLSPVYGAGGLLAAALARGPLGGAPWWQRAAGYAASLTALEYASCQLGRAIGGHVNWSYDGECIDGWHAAAWGALGLVVEAIDPIFGE
jgi:hypothetical protein